MPKSKKTCLFAEFRKIKGKMLLQFRNKVGLSNLEGMHAPFKASVKVFAFSSGTGPGSSILFFERARYSVIGQSDSGQPETGNHHFDQSEISSGAWELEPMKSTKRDPRQRWHKLICRLIPMKLTQLTKRFSLVLESTG
eukprot:Lithocolla_globosa_v1_NODE_2922_length_1822_cov_16.747029.p5 type:complete len:139 gc:universal NODE_2922_length_1822_cov_16.747029:113-529(+)